MAEQNAAAAGAKQALPGADVMAGFPRIESGVKKETT